MKKALCGFLVLGLSSGWLSALGAEEIHVEFARETVGAEPASFTALVGRWHVDQDGTRRVYAVDGRNWERGALAGSLVDKVKGLYGERYAEFLDNLEAYKYFPLSICPAVKDFSTGSISVDFKCVSGRIDQAAGIAFNLQENGDYLVVRANPLENNLVLFEMKHGKRSSVQWIRNVPTPTGQWHTLTVVITGNRVQGYLNSKKYITYICPENIRGKVGLWSKSDSYVWFDNFLVTPR